MTYHQVGDKLIGVIEQIRDASVLYWSVKYVLELTTSTVSPQN